MLGADGEILYVGKARSLKARVGSYFHAGNVSPKVQAMVGQVAGIEVTLTDSETEALLLEYNLIKEHKPRFNVILRDDKSFPYIHVTTEARFPRLNFYRGARNLAGPLLRPVPERGCGARVAAAAAEALQAAQLRRHLLREPQSPVPAVPDRALLGPVRGIHHGGGVPTRCRQRGQGSLRAQRGGERGAGAGRWKPLPKALQFERAARLRDQLASLQQIQSQQSVTAASKRDADVVALATESGDHCIALMFIRGGRNLGSTQFFPRAPLGDEGEIMSAFLMQYYFTREAPREILLNTPIAGRRCPRVRARRSCRTPGAHPSRCARAGLHAGWL